jgi:hypothetical protein
MYAKIKPQPIRDTMLKTEYPKSASPTAQFRMNHRDLGRNPTEEGSQHRENEGDDINGVNGRRLSSSETVRISPNPPASLAF